MNEKESSYTFLNLAGSSYDLGCLQGEALRQVPGWVEFLRSAPAVFSPETFAPLHALFERWCPGVNEEIRGLANVLGIPVEQVIYYAATCLTGSNCSQLAVLPAGSADGHVYAARSFDFSDQSNDARFCLTRVEGKYAHMGCSVMLFGRSEGLNEHGLSVTTSAGGIPVGNNFPGQPKPPVDGLQFWALVRSLLENCRTVEEAIQWAKDFPNASNTILIIADRSGQAARLEFFGTHIAIHRAEPGEAGLWAANHYAAAEMLPLQNIWMENSRVRAERMEAFICQNSGKITLRNLREVYSTPYPQGLSCTFYEEFFGTLHAVIFDLTAGEAWICFGAPQVNEWHRFDFHAAKPFEIFKVRQPMEKAPAGFFAPRA